MTPFQQFRLWLRRAPAGERALASIATAVVLALLGWLASPGGGTGVTVNGSLAGGGASGTGSQSVTGASSVDRLASAPGGVAPGAGGGSATQVAGSSVQPATAGGGSSAGGQLPTVGGSAAGGRCASPPGSDQGVTNTEIKIALLVVDAGGSFGNSAFGVPSPAQQQATYQYIVNAINASGGVACRRLAAQYFHANPIDQAGLQQVCLSVVQARVFFTIDSGAYALYPQLATCYAQHQVPFFTFSLVPEQEQRRFYPYFFGQGLFEPVYRNMVFALAHQGFYAPAHGFRKLGLIFRSCDAQLPGAVLSAVHQAAALSSAQIVTYDLGCPSGFASPSDLEQAVVQFRTQNVSHVTEIDDAVDFPNFTTIAQQQKFMPKYGLADDFILPTTYTSTHPDYQNIVGAITVTHNRWGEERTPGMSPSAATSRCDAILRPHGEAPVWKQADGIGGANCDELWLLRAAVDHAPALRRTELAAGLQAARTIDFSFPFGPADFSRPGTTYGSQFWRVVEFRAGCNCWQVVDRTFHPGFA